MRCQLYVLALLLAIQGHATAETYLEDSYSLLGKCKSTDAFFLGVCYGYITGEIDALEAERSRKNLSSCLPKATSVREMVEWATAALAAHGVGGGLPASIVIGNAYAERCNTALHPPH
jgi:Rap1a immunity proteins